MSIKDIEVAKPTLEELKAEAEQLFEWARKNFDSVCSLIQANLRSIQSWDGSPWSADVGDLPIGFDYNGSDFRSWVVLCGQTYYASVGIVPKSRTVANTILYFLQSVADATELWESTLTLLPAVEGVDIDEAFNSATPSPKSSEWIRIRTLERGELRLKHHTLLSGSPEDYYSVFTGLGYCTIGHEKSPLKLRTGMLKDHLIKAIKAQAFEA